MLASAGRYRRAEVSDPDRETDASFDEGDACLAPNRLVVRDDDQTNGHERDGSAEGR